MFQDHNSIFKPKKIIMKMSKYKYSDDLAYVINIKRTVAVKKGQCYEGERCQKT